MKVVVTERAADELEAILSFLKPLSPMGAKSVQVAVQRAFSVLEVFPRIGRMQKVPGLRRLVARPYPYNIYYVVDEESAVVMIISIVHTSRKPKFADM